ncbi:MAG: YcgL domain-containing protein [Halomonadaceae bacterium]|nr:MAG: YcgL domain-containing protein [Halomonadaceae bacterium]
MMCRIYRSGKKEGMYLYVNKTDELQRVPEALLTMFGKAHHAMDILLRPERKLARADTAEVMVALAEPGYYLQTPPADEDDYKLNLMGEYS